MEIRAPSRVLAWSSELSVRASICPGPSRNTQKRFLSTPVLSDAVRGAWAGLSAGQLPPATKHSVLSTALLTAPLFTKTCMPRQHGPDKKFCLACLPSFRPGRWLRGSGQALILNFPNFRSGVRPAAPPPAPPLPLTPQGCLICKSGSLCKFWGRGVGWAGLRTLM